MLGNYALCPKRPCQFFKCLGPQPVIVSFGGESGTGCDLALSPDAKDACMSQIDPVLAVQPIQALDDIVRITWACVQTLVGSVTCAFTPGDQSSHGPKPGRLGVVEGLGMRDGPGLNPLLGVGFADGVGHEGAFPVEIRREWCAIDITIGCIQLQVNMVDFPISFGSNS
jgi:hypothetical protein